MVKTYQMEALQLSQTEAMVEGSSDQAFEFLTIVSNWSKCC